MVSCAVPLARTVSQWRCCLPAPRAAGQGRHLTSRAVSAADVQHLFVITLVLPSRPTSSTLCSASCTTSRRAARTTTTRAPPPNAAPAKLPTPSPWAKKQICIIGHAAQVYSNIQLWIIHIQPRVSNAYFAAAAASRITRSTLSGIVAYLALSSRAWPHESASLTLKSVLGKMRSSPSEGTMLSAWMSLAL